MPGSQTNSNSKSILDVVHKGVRFIPRPGCALGLGVFAIHQEVHINCQLYIQESPSLLSLEATAILSSVTSFDNLRGDQLSLRLHKGWSV